MDLGWIYGGFRVGSGWVQVGFEAGSIRAGVGCVTVHSIHTGKKQTQ